MSTSDGQFPAFYTASDDQRVDQTWQGWTHEQVLDARASILPLTEEANGGYPNYGLSWPLWRVSASVFTPAGSRGAFSALTEYLAALHGHYGSVDFYTHGDGFTAIGYIRAQDTRHAYLLVLAHIERRMQLLELTESPWTQQVFQQLFTLPAAIVAVPDVAKRVYLTSAARREEFGITTDELPEDPWSES